MGKSLKLTQEGRAVRSSGPRLEGERRKGLPEGPPKNRRFSATPVGLREALISKTESQRDFSFTSDLSCTA